ncbi:V-type ATP synthase subunit I [Konateibacter massiliensis]|uniref:V-type ATP synthase subunit I n=1 Tax=Konateibacter massiliensis TaxID=2002841 RepID=UPI000C1510C0|nr:V-type ATPase 116kDa subunit family protein [Konateibacter massiliensis]
MIVKMKFLSVTGPKADIDRVSEHYLSKYDVQLENSQTELKTLQDLRPYVEINPYKNLLIKASDYLNLVTEKGPIEPTSITLEETEDKLLKLEKVINDLKFKRQAQEDKKVKYLDLLHKIEPFRELNYDVEKILNFKFIKYRFGKISKDYFAKLEHYMYSDLDTIFYRCHTDESYVWGVYFLPAYQEEKIDDIYESMHFERLNLPAEYNGTPDEAFHRLESLIDSINDEIKAINNEITEKINSSKTFIYAAYKTLDELSRNFDVRKLAACTNNEISTFYIVCGWMTETDAEAFQKEVSEDPNVFCIIEDEFNNILSSPPTKLENPKFFKPFEMFLKMYGLPAYNEFDPTIFVAITYTFIFGIMFGDLGQGFILFAGGILLYKYKKMDIAAIVSVAGVFSMIFGVLYGSVFGFEDVFPAVWMHPMHTYVTLPLVGNINTILVLAIAFGMGLILLAMIFNMINGIRQKNVEKIFFDTNGVAGFVFYGSVVACAVLFMTGNTLPGGIILFVMFILPLIVIAMKEPLAALVERKADELPKEVGMFLVQSIFELVEVLLSYMSNTISFVRIGAFALSHAGMMQVVMSLAGAENGSPNWIVVVIGNLLVLAMEGLIVGIHVLRLEYYEIFSRFFSGSGREFIPYSKQKQ